MSATTPRVGTPGTSIAAQCVGPDVGTKIQAADVGNALLSIENDMATAKGAIGYGQATTVAGVWVVSDGTVGIQQFPVPVSGTAALLLDLPHGSSINTITVRVTPATHMSLPGTMPHIQLGVVTVDGGAVTAQTMTDPSASTGAYNVTHSIALVISPAIIVDRTANLYGLTFYQEHGANSAEGNVAGAFVILN